MMNKIIVLAVSVLLLLSSCKAVAPVSNQSSKSAKTQVLAGFPYQYLNSNLWSVAETADNVYFAKDDGIYRFQKANKAVKRLYQVDSACNLVVYNSQIYFLVAEKICKMDLDGKNVATVLDTKGFSTDYGEMNMDSFQISDHHIICRSALELLECGLSGVGLHELRGKSGLAVDANRYQLVGDSVYYIDHAERTFTLYRYDLTTNAIEIVRGKGISMPKDNYIEDFTFVNNELYYYQNNQIKKYHPKASDTVICDYTGTPFTVSELEGYQGQLYYLTYMSSIISDGYLIKSTEDVYKNQHQIEDSGFKQYAIVQLNPKNNRTSAVCQFGSVISPLNLQFADGTAFFKTDRFKSSTNDDTIREVHVVNLSSGEMR